MFLELEQTVYSFNTTLSYNQRTREVMTTPATHERPLARGVVEVLGEGEVLFDFGDFGGPAMMEG